MFRGEALTAISQTSALTFKIDAFLVSIMAGLAVIVLIDTLYELYSYLSERPEVAKTG